MQDIIFKIPGFSLAQTLGCGQAFRWKETAPNRFAGICGSRRLVVSQDGDILRLHSIQEEDAAFWRSYFDLDTDYSAFQSVFSADPTLQTACRYCGGIRILRQDPWEALISFIISQNNNIPRITGIIDRLCTCFGNDCGGYFSFPPAETLACRTPEELAPLRAGFRTKYILDAARKTADGTVQLQKIPHMPLDTARAELMKIKGVGIKVADCALLYGFHRLDAFPVDTWIKKVLAEFYPDGFPAEIQPCGVAQQYLFHFIRNRDHMEKDGG